MATGLGPVACAGLFRAAAGPPSRGRRAGFSLGCMLGGFVAMGGHLIVIWQPWEFVIIGGMAAGTFVIPRCAAWS
jgi:hypothetical protein